MNKDYNDFTKSYSSQAPRDISEGIITMVQNELHPSHKNIFVKLFLIQFFIGMITLLFCPQYHLSFTSNHQLFHYFHHNYGEYICMLICGAIFMAPAMFFAGLIMTRSELKLVIRSKGLHFAGLLSISLGAFFLAGADIFISTSVVWILGGYSSSMVVFNLTDAMKSRVEQT
jgi:hypothetical protein